MIRFLQRHADDLIPSGFSVGLSLFAGITSAQEQIEWSLRCTGLVLASAVSLLTLWRLWRKHRLDE